MSFPEIRIERLSHRKFVSGVSLSTSIPTNHRDNRAMICSYRATASAGRSRRNDAHPYARNRNFAATTRTGANYVHFISSVNRFWILRPNSLARPHVLNSARSRIAFSIRHCIRVVCKINHVEHFISIENVGLHSHSDSPAPIPTSTTPTSHASTGNTMAAKSP